MSQKKALQEHVKADPIHSLQHDLDLPKLMNGVGTCAFLFQPWAHHQKDPLMQKTYVRKRAGFYQYFPLQLGRQLTPCSGYDLAHKVSSKFFQFCVQLNKVLLHLLSRLPLVFPPKHGSPFLGRTWRALHGKHAVKLRLHHLG